MENIADLLYLLLPIAGAFILLFVVCFCGRSTHSHYLLLNFCLLCFYIMTATDHIKLWGKLGSFYLHFLFLFLDLAKRSGKNDRCHKVAPQSTTKSQVQNFDVGGPIHGRPKLLTMWKVATKFRLKISHFVLYSLIISLNDYVVFSQQIQAITHTIHTSLFLIGDPHQSVFITTKNDVIKISVIS